MDADSEIRGVLASAGITLDNKIAMLVLAREMGLVTTDPTFTPEDSLRIMSEARPDYFAASPAPPASKPPAIPGRSFASAARSTQT